jgi:putative spermidine/putrescine transport system substrate-binding protein
MKRLFGSAILALGALAASGASGQEVTLRIGNYGGIFTETTQRCTAEYFTYRTGHKVRFTDGTPTDHLAKILASQGRGEPPLDLAYLDDGPHAQAVESGVVEKIDRSIITNADMVYDAAKVKGDFGIGINTSSVGLAYNTKIFAEQGIPEPKSWSDLWNPKLANRVALPDITTSAGMNFVIVAAWQQGKDEKDVKDAWKKIADMKPHYFFKSSADLKSKFLAGDVWAAPWYNGRSWQMIGEGFPMKYVFPDGKGFAQITFLDPVKGTKFKKEAMQYINIALDPMVQLCNSSYLPYGPTNKTLTNVLAAYPKMSQQFPSSDADLKKMYLVDWDVVNRDFPKWLESWNRIVAK